jgi:hypothetical protein
VPFVVPYLGLMILLMMVDLRYSVNDIQQKADMMSFLVKK